MASMKFTYGLFHSCSRREGGIGEEYRWNATAGGAGEIKIGLMAIYRLPLAVMVANSGDSSGDKRAVRACVCRRRVLEGKRDTRRGVMGP